MGDDVDKRIFGALMDITRLMLIERATTSLMHMVDVPRIVEVLWKGREWKEERKMNITIRHPSAAPSTNTRHTLSRLGYR